jgi:hypothetical protein
MNSARLSGVVAAILLTTIALTGCGGSAAPSGGNTGDNGAATSGPADGGGDGGTDAEDLGGETTLPATFPVDDVPLIEGDIAYAIDLGTGWTVYIYRDDFLGGYEEAKGLLLDAGFTGDTIGQDDAGAFGQFTDDGYTVNLQGADDGSFGATVAYTVVKKG